jgi:hypothetical protein
MIIGNLNVVSVGLTPSETDAVLIVDTNTILSATITFQRLKVIPGKHGQITELSRGVQLFELPLSYSLNLLKATTAQAMKYCFSFFVSKRADHNSLSETPSVIPSGTANLLPRL